VGQLRPIRPSCWPSNGLLAFAAITKRTVASYVVFQGERSQRFESGVLAIPYLRFLREELPALAT
jgi:hypothetical protein